MHKRKILPFVLALAILPLFAFVGQDPLTPEQEKAAEGMTAQFASLRYTTSSKQDEVVLAKTLTKIQMSHSKDGDVVWLELFFHNGDYVFVKADSVTFYAGSTGLQSSKVLLSRVPFDRASFPRLIP